MSPQQPVPANVRDDEIDLDPDDPLLARAQEALKRQLKETQLRVQEELREKTKLLNDAKQRKEDLGVNLFNFQQQLATLQMELEKSHETHTKVAAQKDAVAERVQELNTQHDEEVNIRQGERLRTDKLQEELDRCASCSELFDGMRTPFHSAATAESCRQAATLHQIEAYHTSMKQEIAVTRRATYKAEESIQNLEKEKGQQDSLIDKLQETLKSLHQHAALVTAQVGSWCRSPQHSAFTAETSVTGTLNHVHPCSWMPRRVRCGPQWRLSSRQRRKWRQCTSKSVSCFHSGIRPCEQSVPVRPLLLPSRQHSTNSKSKISASQMKYIASEKMLWSSRSAHLHVCSPSR